MGKQASMTQLCTIAVQSSGEVTQLKKNEGPLKPPLFVYPRMTELHSFPGPISNEQVTPRERESRRLSDLICGQIQSGSILNKLLFACPPLHLHPTPRCLRCSGVPSGCSSGHKRTFWSRFAKLRNSDSREKESVSAQDFISTRCHPGYLGRTHTGKKKIPSRVDQAPKRRRTFVSLWRHLGPSTNHLFPTRYL